MRITFEALMGPPGNRADTRLTTVRYGSRYPFLSPFFLLKHWRRTGGGPDREGKAGCHIAWPGATKIRWANAETGGGGGGGGWWGGGGGGGGGNRTATIKDLIDWSGGKSGFGHRGK